MHDPLRSQRERARSLRSEFFNEILSTIDAPASEGEIAVGLARYHVASSAVGLIKDPAMGSLIINVRPKFHGRDLQISYAIKQIGYSLRLALVLKGEARMAPMLEGTFEIDSLWPCLRPKLLHRDETVIYEWDIVCPGSLLDDYLSRESFILGVREFHLRVLRILSDGLAPGASSPSATGQKSLRSA